MKSKKKVWITLGVVAVIALMVILNLSLNRKSALAVESQKVEERELRAVVSASGKIRAKTSVDISASTSGKVVKLAVDEGDHVKPGQFLLQIDPTPAEASVRQIEASIAAAKANLELAKANLEQAKIELDRQESLFQKNLTSEELLQKARTSYNVQKLQTDAAQQDIQRLQAMLASARHELQKVNVHSDISGIVTKRNIEEGENVFVGAFNNPATVLLTIADLSIIEAEVEVDETDIINVHVGQEATVKVDAYPDSSFKGKVTKVGRSPILSTATGLTQQQATSFEVIVQVTDTIPNVRPGLSCKAEITTGYREKAIAVPIQALTLRKPSELKPLIRKGRKNPGSDDEAKADTTKEKEIQGAFVINDGKVQYHEVKTGIAGDRFFEVLSGLQPKDEVVIGPFSALRRLRNGDAVKIEKKKKETK
ncbi:MAG: efflux RND transporter periplasmic adaptor subunit [candidate division KSB1 bacterium]|nr:efflux RND transporter periplasmic adaptor subunit [candidate division KSB1 bacterium]MDZ7301771.1 efflux RND transporter periplasmic adaptor subunit [candidate division KSB1 bacterium]MDZ7311450.1 efflux RND transporter periplasmic adaptor subunit [candidate division KSB1 bacterium]